MAKARVGEHRDDQPGQRAGRDRVDVPRLDRAGQPVLQQGPAEAVDEVFPCLGAEHPRAVHQDDPAGSHRADAHVKERGDAVADVLQGRGGFGGELLVQ